MPSMVRVESSSIRAVGYDEQRRRLYVEFHHGARYRYDGVPPFVHRALVGADSVGGWFNRNVRDRYPCERL